LALEGYKEHSILTYAILETLSNIPSGGGLLSEVTSKVDERVEEISYDLTKNDPEFDGYIQNVSVARNGHDFKISHGALKNLDIEFGDLPPDGSYVTIGNVSVYAEPRESEIITTLPKTYYVKIIEENGDWVKVRNRREIFGYVKRAELAEIQYTR